MAEPAQKTEAKESILSINNIEVVYDEVILVLRGISLEVPKGEIVTLLGPNGAGKSTTLKAISGLLQTEDGEEVDQVVIADRSAKKGQHQGVGEHHQEQQTGQGICRKPSGEQKADPQRAD